MAYTGQQFDKLYEDYRSGKTNHELMVELCLSDMAIAQQLLGRLKQVPDLLGLNVPNTEEKYPGWQATMQALHRCIDVVSCLLQDRLPPGESDLDPEFTAIANQILTPQRLAQKAAAERQVEEAAIADISHAINELEKQLREKQAELKIHKDKLEALKGNK